MNKEVFTPAEFLKRLEDKQFKKTSSLVGLVKLSNDADSIDFSFTNCESWVTIRTSFIQEIQFIRSVPCKDHQHPLVEMVFPEFATEEGKLLSSLLTSLAGSQLTATVHDNALQGVPMAQHMPTADLDPSVLMANPTGGNCYNQTCKAVNGAYYPCKQLINGSWYCNRCCVA